jgi:hypothetical protein
MSFFLLRKIWPAHSFSYTYYQSQWIPFSSVFKGWNREKIVASWTKCVEFFEPLRFVYKRSERDWKRGVRPFSSVEVAKHIRTVSYAKRDDSYLADRKNLLTKALVDIMDGVRDREQLAWRVVLVSFQDKERQLANRNSSSSRSAYDEYEVYVLAHHLILDGNAVGLLAKSILEDRFVQVTSYQAWASALQQYAQFPDNMDRPPAYWAKFRAEEVLTIPGDRDWTVDRDAGNIGRWRCAVADFDLAKWKAVLDAAKKLACGPLSILTASALRLYQLRNEQQNVRGLLEFVFNGRKGPHTCQDLDVSQTFGFFATNTLEYFAVNVDDSARKLLTSAQAVLRDVPNGGYDYRLCPSPKRAHLDACGSILINYFFTEHGQDFRAQNETRLFDFPDPVTKNRIGIYAIATPQFFTMNFVYHECHWTEKGMELLMKQYWDQIVNLYEDMTTMGKL